MNLPLFVLFLLSCNVPQRSLIEAVDLLGEISIEFPGLLNVFTHPTASNEFTRHSILAATYDTRIATEDSAYILLHPGLGISSNFSGFQPTPLYSGLYWPKEIAQVPASVFGRDVVVTPDGSTVIGKTNGAVYLSDVTNFNNPSTYDITSGLLPQAWIYGRIIWKRMTLNLRIDGLTCRTQFEGGSVKYAQLVWIEHPRNDELTSRWSVNVLKESACDTNLAEMVISINRDDWEIVYTTGLHSRKLAFFWAENGQDNPGNWDNPNQVQTGVLGTGREYFDVQVADLNNDGRKEVLVTVVANSQGSVEVYQLPSDNDWRDPNRYIQHIIASGFTSRNGGANGRSPGLVRVFYPTNNRALKPWILLTGDDDGRAYYLRPNSEHPGDWIYQMVIILDEGPNQTISGVAVVDIDGDGYAEVFLSVRNRDVIKVVSFKNIATDLEYD